MAGEGQAERKRRASEEQLDTDSYQMECTGGLYPVLLTVIGERSDTSSHIEPHEYEIARPTAFAIVRVAVSDEELLTIVRTSIADPSIATGSVLSAALEEGKPIYLIGVRFPNGVQDTKGYQVMGSDLPTWLSLGLVTVAVGSAILLARTPTTAFNRRDMLKSLMLGGSVLAVGASHIPAPDAGRPHYNELRQIFEGITPEERELFFGWRAMLEAFRDLVIARKIHAAATLQSGRSEQAILAAIPANRPGIREALLLTAQQREQAIETFMEKAIRPLAERGDLTLEHLGQIEDTISRMDELHLRAEKNQIFMQATSLDIATIEELLER